MRPRHDVTRVIALFRAGRLIAGVGVQQVVVFE
jgi:hypothetical protein